jgi:hypothetical protein
VTPGAGRDGQTSQTVAAAIPLATILAVQAALSLHLVWSNTANKEREDET